MADARRLFAFELLGERRYALHRRGRTEGAARQVVAGLARQAAGARGRLGRQRLRRRTCCTTASTRSAAREAQRCSAARSRRLRRLVRTLHGQRQQSLRRGRSKGAAATAARSTPNSCTVAARSLGQCTGAVQHAEVHRDRPERRAVHRRLRERAHPTVQRRTARFAGEAVSDGSGINKGDRPSFVVGNMGKPVVRVGELEQVLCRRPRRAVRARLRRVAIQGHRRRCGDGDLRIRSGLPESEHHRATTRSRYSVTRRARAAARPPRVTITVDRNFRAPIALDGRGHYGRGRAARDRASEADDPDGIVGQDFLGPRHLDVHDDVVPEHGELTGGGANWTYRPGAGFLRRRSLHIQG